MCLVLGKSLRKSGRMEKEIESGTKISQVDELGDVLFTIVNLARFYGLISRGSNDASESKSLKEISIY